MTCCNTCRWWEMKGSNQYCIFGYCKNRHSSYYQRTIPSTHNCVVYERDKYIPQIGGAEGE